MGETKRTLSRREVLRTALFGGSGLLAAYAVGCRDGDSKRLGPDTASPSGSPTDTGTAAPIVTAAAPQWRKITSTTEGPSPRRDHSLVTDGERLYVFGGRNAETLRDLWAFDLKGLGWSQLRILSESAIRPQARFGHNSVWDEAGGRMILFGGQDGGFFNDVWAYDGSQTWTQLAPEPGPSTRYGAAAAYDEAGLRVFVTHGFTDQGRFDDTWALTLVQNPVWGDLSPEGTRPVERCLMRAVWDDTRERLLMFGGQTTGVPYLGDTWVLGAAGWTEILTDPKPSPRNFYSMAFANREVLLFGGETAEGKKNDLWVFAPDSDEWTELPLAGEKPSPRSGHDMVWLTEAGKIVMFGGRDESGDLDDLWELSVAG